MPRKKIIYSDTFPYHITVSCVNKEWFKIPKDEVWNIHSRYLDFVSRAYDAEVMCHLLMSNHFHTIMRTPRANLPEITNYFLRETSKCISKSSGRINQVYGGPYHWGLINSETYLQNAYKYIYRNPVRANMCKQVEDYKYSSLPGLLGQQHLGFPCYAPEDLFTDTIGHLKWLNEAPTEVQSEARKKAMQKNIFKISKDKSGREVELEVRRTFSTSIFEEKVRRTF